MTKAKYTQDQERAQRAFGCVQEVEQGKDASTKKKYSTQCRRLPQLIQQCGLCQTVAFLQSKAAEPAVARALADFAEVVEHGQSATDFAKKCRQSELKEYQWMSRHAIQCASWMKRYAEALLPRGED